jgi:hypothetical protein
VTGGERGDTAQRRLRARDTRLAGPRHRAVGLLALPTAAAAARLSCCAHGDEEAHAKGGYLWDCHSAVALLRLRGKEVAPSCLSADRCTICSCSADAIVIAALAWYGAKSSP